MSSILTNNSAMVALQTLKSINSNLAKTQSMISTGKSVASAKDNSAVWAISKVMESDVKGFKAISESLSLGQSTVAVARNAAERVTDLLNDIKGKIIGANEENFDGEKLQTDLAALRDQISSITNAAQFNGLNLLDNKKSGTAIADILKNKGSSNVNILSSLDRAADGTVSSSTIGAGKQDLGTSALVFGAGTDIAAAAFTSAAATNVATLTFVGDTASAARQGNRVLAGDSYRVTLNATMGAAATGNVVEYVARDGDTIADVAKAMEARIAYNLKAAGSTAVVARNTTTNAVTITAATGTTVTAATVAVNTGGTAGGGLELLSKLDVSTLDGAKASLSAFESLVQTSIDAAANFGSSEGRIEIQRDFVTALSDSLKSGIGALVDANMEEASARLQALQVQQQLGVQSLSIANQAPQSILSLFR